MIRLSVNCIPRNKTSSALRNGDNWLVCSSKKHGGPVRFGSARSLSSSGANFRPLFDSPKNGVGIAFGILVKWAVKLLGAESEYIEENFPRQFLSPLELRRGKQCSRKGTSPGVERMREELEKVRGERGIKCPVSERSVFKRQSALTIDGVTLRYEKDHDEWFFDTEWIPIATVVKFAVRILRDEKTAKEWALYHVPWLADDDELGAKVPVQPESGLTLVGICSKQSVGLVKVDGGYQIVRVTEVGDASFIADERDVPPSIPEWSSFVGLFADLFQEVSFEDLATAGGDIPVVTQGGPLSAWLYRAGSRNAVDAKEKNISILARRYGSHDAHRFFETLEGPADAAVRVGEVLLRWKPNEGLSVVGENGGNPILSMETLLRVLALVLSARRTEAECLRQSAPWLLGWLQKRFQGEYLPEAVVDADVVKAKTEPSQQRTREMVSIELPHDLTPPSADVQIDLSELDPDFKRGLERILQEMRKEIQAS